MGLSSQPGLKRRDIPRLSRQLSLDVCDTKADRGQDRRADQVSPASSWRAPPTRLLLVVERGYFLLANAFETSRAHSMKRSTTGLKVRFFNVMIVTSHGRVGTSTGNIFKRYSALSWRSRDFGTTVMNRPRDASFARR